MIVCLQNCTYVCIINELSLQLYHYTTHPTIIHICRVAQPELVFSSPSYTDINVTIIITEIDATG